MSQSAAMRNSESRIAAIPSTGSHAPSHYFLQAHIFLAQARRHWVILDVLRDKYLCVDRHQFESLGPWMDGWADRTPLNETSASAPPTEAAALAEQLLDIGILSRNPAGAKAARPTAYPVPTQSLVSDLPAGARKSPWPAAASFFLSSLRASRSLRNNGFAATIEHVRARKHGGQGAAQSFDSERAHALITAFNELRLFYPRSYLCLFDSLALIDFLAHYRVYPDWVFGVSADPFEAHCWVQSGHVVLNDTLERVSALTPILYV